jgi:hypothetical protein
VLCRQREYRYLLYTQVPANDEHLAVLRKQTHALSGLSECKAHALQGEEDGYGVGLVIRLLYDTDRPTSRRCRKTFSRSRSALFFAIPFGLLPLKADDNITKEELSGGGMYHPE